MGPGGKNREFVERYVQMLVGQGREAEALGEAARWGRIDLIESLLEGGLGVDARTATGGTALLAAASGGQPNVVAYLIERGADVHAVSGWNGSTPMIACVAALHPKRVYLKVLKLLLRAGGARTLGVRDADGRTALDWAKDGRPAEVIALLEGDPTA